MSKKHLQTVIQNLQKEIQGVYEEAYNDGLKDGRDEMIIKFGKSTYDIISPKNQDTFNDKNMIVSILSQLPTNINIEYNGGSNPGWKENCTVTSSNNTSIKVKIDSEYKTFLYKKIKSVKYSDDHIQLAIKNFAQFHKLDNSNVTESDVRNSSAGIDGWANSTDESDLIEKFKNIEFNNGSSGSSEKNKKRRTVK